MVHFCHQVLCTYRINFCTSVPIQWLLEGLYIFRNIVSIVQHLNMYWNRVTPFWHFVTSQFNECRNCAFIMKTSSHGRHTLTALLALLWEFTLPLFSNTRCIVWEISSTAHRRARVLRRHRINAVNLRTQPTSKQIKYSVTTVVGILRYGFHIPMGRHTNFNYFFWIYTNTVWQFSNFQTCDMCSFEISCLLTYLKRVCLIYFRLPLWRHHACMTTYPPKKNTSTRSCWHQFISEMNLL